MYVILSSFSIFSIFLFMSCGDINNSDLFQNIDKHKNPSNFIIGTWKQEGSDAHYYLLENGNGYYESYKKNDGINKRTLNWEIRSDSVWIELVKDGYFPLAKIGYKISENSNATQLIKGKTVYTKISDKVINKDYNSKPYANYIRIFGYYYEVSKVVMRCNHGTGTSSNFKFLLFYGANESMTPIGATFSYATPYYEGISKEWNDGSYTIKSGSGHWTYVGWYCNNGANSGQCEGKLQIKTTNKIKKIDFNLDDGDCVGHCEGNWYYE